MPPFLDAAEQQNRARTGDRYDLNPLLLNFFTPYPLTKKTGAPEGAPVVHH
jgi:hypothetical protein